MSHIYHRNGSLAAGGEKCFQATAKRADADHAESLLDATCYEVKRLAEEPRNVALYIKSLTARLLCNSPLACCEQPRRCMEHRFDSISCPSCLSPLIPCSLISMTLSPSLKCYEMPDQGSRLTFGDATIDDAKDLNRLYNEVIREETSLEWDVERPLSERVDYLQKMTQTRYPCILVREGQELVAFGALERFTVGDGAWTLDREPLLRLLAEGGTSFFSARISIVVSRLYRRNGLATSLWNRLADHSYVMV